MYIHEMFISCEKGNTSLLYGIDTKMCAYAIQMEINRYVCAYLMVVWNDDMNLFEACIASFNHVSRSKRQLSYLCSQGD